MTSKFEQLIEYVINDEEAKAKELFHDIVVEKSREIYENLMNEESDAEEDDHAERAAKEVKKDIEYDDAEDKKERADEDMGGDAADDLIADVDTDESGMTEEESDAEFDDEAEEAGEEETKDIEHDHDAEGSVEDRVVDLEDKLDELMAEFEALLGDEVGDDAGEEMISIDDEVGGDAYAQDDTSEFQDVPMSENVDLKAAPKPVTTEPAGTNTKSTTAFNSGAAGMAASPVKMTGDTAQGRPAPKTDSLPGAGNFKNVPAKDGSKLAPAPKPTLSQAAGVNTKTPFPKG
jgi:hypothetical protein